MGHSLSLAPPLENSPQVALGSSTQRQGWALDLNFLL